MWSSRKPQKCSEFLEKVVCSITFSVKTEFLNLHEIINFLTWNYINLILIYKSNLQFIFRFILNAVKNISITHFATDLEIWYQKHCFQKILRIPWNFEWIPNFTNLLRTLRKKCMQQKFFFCPEKSFYCPNKTFCLSNHNLMDIAKCFSGTTKEFCCINTNKIFLLIWQNCFLSEYSIENLWKIKKFMTQIKIKRPQKFEMLIVKIEINLLHPVSCFRLITIF